MTSVLIADDDEDIRELFDDELMESGFDVYLAHNGVEAMEMLRTFVPEVVLVDLKMPESHWTNFVATLSCRIFYRKFLLKIITCIMDAINFKIIFSY